MIHAPTACRPGANKEAASLDPLDVWLLRAGIWEPARALEAWTEFCARVEDIEALEMDRYRFFPLVARNLESLAPVTHGEYLQSTMRHSWARSNRQLSWLLEVLAALRAEKIEALVLRGAALVPVYYQHWGGHPGMELGLLVSPGEVERTGAIMTRLGATCRTSNEAEAVWENPDKIAIHLRWHLLPNDRHAAAEAAIWNEAEPLTLPGFEAKTLNPVAHFLALAMSGAGLNPQAAMPRLADAAMILRRRNFDWAALESRARDFHRIAPVRDFLIQLGELDLGVPAPIIEHWRKLENSPLEKLEQACIEQRTLPRRRIKAAALVYLRLHQGGHAGDFWRELSPHLRRVPEVKGVHRRLAVAAYLLRYKKFVKAPSTP